MKTNPLKDLDYVQSYERIRNAEVEIQAVKIVEYINNKLKYSIKGLPSYIAFEPCEFHPSNIYDENLEHLVNAGFRIWRVDTILGECKTSFLVLTWNVSSFEDIYKELVASQSKYVKGDYIEISPQKVTSNCS